MIEDDEFRLYYDEVWPKSIEPVKSQQEQKSNKPASEKSSTPNISNNSHGNITLSSKNSPSSSKLPNLQNHGIVLSTQMENFQKAIDNIKKGVDALNVIFDKVKEAKSIGNKKIVVPRVGIRKVPNISKYPTTLSSTITVSKRSNQDNRKRMYNKSAFQELEEVFVGNFKHSGIHKHRVLAPRSYKYRSSAGSSYGGNSQQKSEPEPGKSDAATATTSSSDVSDTEGLNAMMLLSFSRKSLISKKAEPKLCACNHTTAPKKNFFVCPPNTPITGVSSDTSANFLLTMPVIVNVTVIRKSDEDISRPFVRKGTYSKLVTLCPEPHNVSNFPRVGEGYGSGNEDNVDNEYRKSYYTSRTTESQINTPTNSIADYWQEIGNNAESRRTSAYTLLKSYKVDGHENGLSNHKIRFESDLNENDEEDELTESDDNKTRIV